MGNLPRVKGVRAYLNKSDALTSLVCSHFCYPLLPPALSSSSALIPPLRMCQESIGLVDLEKSWVSENIFISVSYLAASLAGIKC